ARGGPGAGPRPPTGAGGAAAAGRPPAPPPPPPETLRLALTLGSAPFLLSVDAEGGYSDDPDEVGELARQLAAVGAVGINLEDALGPADRHAAKIAAVRGAAPGLFVNARTDTYWSGDGDWSDTLRRLEAYREAGADGVFVPGLTDPARIASLTARFDVPLNVLYTPAGPDLAHLADLGVGRVSLGSLLYRRALGAALEAAADLRAGREPGGPTPTYDEVRELTG
ncbi:isocitrate lyase/phosphoenolpyruvate mutase family protein, partial [Streptomyces sp. NPDC059712]|uniref:isocitrate lyase/PEP mutase family protein n=1 Tax=Streptomyces sp. NPDC059712 TaxID=3346919 RepID=UPI0036ADE55C